MRIVTILLLTMEGLMSLASSYLLVLLGVAASKRRAHPLPVDTNKHLRFVVLVPAHDEETGIGTTLDSLRALDYPRDHYEVIVIADNCRDRTAEVARARGATVYERTDPWRRGKGYALAWALDRLRAERREVDAIVFLDADCQASPNMLSAIETRLRAGAEAVQVNYVVANPGDSWVSGLRFAAFTLMNTVRPLGKASLGLSCGLLGTGMALTWAVLERHPWQAFSLTEDSEYHMRLVAAGERVVFAPEAAVRSAMPTSLQQAEAQQLRWEGGRWHLLRTWALPLIWSGVRQRDLVRLHAGLEPLILPQALLLAGNAVLLAAALALRCRPGLSLGAMNLVGQSCYVIGGLVLVRAPAHVYRALALAPVLMLWKVGLHMRLLIGRGPKGWVRARRSPLAGA